MTQIVRRLVCCSFVVVAAIAASSPGTAQGIAVSGGVGTLGVGGGVAIGIGQRIGLRASGNIQPWELTQEYDDVEFTLNLSSPSFSALLDLYVAGPLRLSGGAVFFGGDTEVRGRLTGPVAIGNQTYTADQVGTLSGVFDTSETAPYAGIGLGKVGGRKGMSFMLDLGVAFQGAPAVNLSATGPIASQPAFQANLAQEETNIEEDARPFRFYPVLSLGLVLGF
jgi:hypothetical protein